MTEGRGGKCGKGMFIMLESEFARAAITKYHILSGLNNRNLFSLKTKGLRSRYQ